MSEIKKLYQVYLGLKKERATKLIGLADKVAENALLKITRTNINDNDQEDLIIKLRALLILNKISEAMRYKPYERFQEALSSIAHEEVVKIEDAETKLKALIIVGNISEAERLINTDTCFIEATERIVTENSSETDNAKIKLKLLVILRKFTDAIELLNSEKRFTQEFYYENLARIKYLESGNAEAIKVLKDGVKNNPQSIPLLTNYGYLLDINKEYDEAEKIYRRVIKLDVNNVNARNNLAVALWHKGKKYYSKAIAELRYVKELKPSCKQSNLNLAILLAANQQYKEAAMELTQALDLDAEYAQAHYCLGKVQYLMGNVQAAVLSFQKAQRKRLPNLVIKSELFKEFKRFSDNDLTNIVIAIVAENTLITDIDLSHNDLKDIEASGLAEQTLLATLDLKDNQIAEGIEAFADNMTLMRLDIRRNKIGTKSLRKLVENNTTICELLVDDELLTDELKIKIKRMHDRNRGNAKLFSKACLQNDIEQVNSLLATHAISPHVLIRKTKLNGLDYALANNKIELATALISGYLNHYKPTVAIFKFVLEKIQKNSNKKEIVNACKDALYNRLTALVAEADVDLVEKAELDLISLSLKDLHIDFKQAMTLAALMKANPSFENLDLSNVTFTATGYSKFLEILKAHGNHLKTLSVVNAGITVMRANLLADIIPSLPNLERLNLNDNYLEFRNVKYLLGKLAYNNKIVHLSIQKNRIACASFEMIVKDWAMGSIKSLQHVSIEGNIFYSKNRDKQLIKLLSIFLKNSSSEVAEFLNLKFIDFNLKKNGGITFIFENKGNLKAIDLSAEEFKSYELYKNNSHMREWGHAEVWNYLTASIYQKLPTEVVSFSDTDKASKFLSDYHKDAPLKSHLKSFSIFKSQPITEIKSLLFPDEIITRTKGNIYLLAKKHNGEHAMLAYERLTSYGQRVFKIAHLQASGDKPKISFYTRGDEPIEKTIEHLLNNYHIAKFEVDGKEIKAMHEDILIEVDKKHLDARFEKALIEFGAGKQESTKVLNCLKWAISKINRYSDKRISVHAYYPSHVVKGIIENPENYIKQSPRPIPKRIAPSSLASTAA